jgi:hypothetical protein
VPGAVAAGAVGVVGAVGNCVEFATVPCGLVGAGSWLCCTTPVGAAAIGSGPVSMLLMRELWHPAIASAEMTRAELAIDRSFMDFIPNSAAHYQC